MQPLYMSFKIKIALIIKNKLAEESRGTFIVLNKYLTLF